MREKTFEEPLERQLVRQFYRGNIPCFCLAAAASLAGGSLNLIVSWLMQQLIDAISGGPDALPLTVLTLLSAAFVMLAALLFLLKYISEPRFIAKAMRQYKELAFRKLTAKSISSFRDEVTAGYLSALTNDAGSIEANYLAVQFSIITKAVTFAGALGMMLFYSPLMTVVAVAVTLLPLAASLLTGSRMQAAEQRVSDRSRDFTAALSDCLSGFDVVKTFRAEKEIFRLFSESNCALEKEKLGKRRIAVLVGMAGAITGIAAQLGVFLAGAYIALSGRGLTAGTVIMFVNLMNFMIGPVSELPALLAGRRAALGLIKKLARALEKNAPAGGSAVVSQVGQGIRFDNVSFGYEDGKEVLHGISAFFEAGKAYAVVGGSGSGKSTLLRLLMAGYPSYSGNIYIDDNELRTVSPESLYGVMSVIQQNVFVFNASIRDNVTMFRDFPRDDTDRAIEHAHLGGLTAERGEDCLCGENGRGLSGGEKQRISIARSLLKRSSVLLADEATSALDAATAHSVASDLLELDGVTRMIVTHTLDASLLRRYDGITALRDGCIAESGSFDELMKRKGYFYALYTVTQ